MSGRGAAPMPRSIGIVADDITGAADTAAAFAGRGWAARVLAGDTVGTARPGTVLACVSHARALAEREAAAVTAAAVRRLADAGVERLYVKIDSTVRGPVAAVVDGAVTAWRSAHPDARALVCPALPSQGRTVSGGVVQVDGAPVADSPSGRDAVTPVGSSRLETLFPAYRALGAAPLLLPGEGWFADAADDGDLDALARLADDDPELVTVGSAGLAGALARRWGRGVAAPIAPAAVGTLLVAVSSRHPVSRGQVDDLLSTRPADVDVIAVGDESHPTPADAAGALAARIEARVRAGGVAALIAVGGDGVAAILTALDARAFDVHGVVADGCPVGVVVGGRADGLRLVTKSGGFGASSTLTDIARTLLPPAVPRGRPLPTDAKDPRHD